jgi:hypothetical protein
MGLTAQETDDLLRHMDVSGAGNISYRDFVREFSNHGQDKGQGYEQTREFVREFDRHATGPDGERHTNKGHTERATAKQLHQVGADTPSAIGGHLASIAAPARC